MTRPVATRLATMAVRGLATRTAASHGLRQPAISTPRVLDPRPSFRNLFSTSHRLAKPLTADELKTAVPYKITDDEYHKLADEILEGLEREYEEMQNQRQDIDVEYSQGVMNITIVDVGVWVVNKQPPNKQIWLSSPITGPKRYDWVVVSEGQDQKMDCARGDWIYMRDGSSLSECLVRETGIDIDHIVRAHS
ncbi:mitochondrial chaperone Frataxin [Astrocystis sublimbata]|nr:mitochondrial chaperone Frataxin [Astrocystis sublimbata]